MVKFRIDVLEELKRKGYTSYRIRKDKIFGQRTMQRLREGKDVSFDMLSRLCMLLECGISDILEYVPDDNEGEKADV